MLKVGQTVLIAWGRLAGKEAVLLEINNSDRAALIRLQGTTVETKVGIMHIKPIG